MENEFNKKETEKTAQKATETENAPETQEVSKKFGIRQVLPLCFMVISIVWIWMGISLYGFWDELKGGQPGFIPIIVASCLLALSSVALFQSFKEKKPKFMPLCFIFLLLGFAQIALSELIGLLPAMLLFVLLWLKIIEKAPWKGTIIMLVSLAAIGYGVFVLWLNVPFPQGVIAQLFV